MLLARLRAVKRIDPHPSPLMLRRIGRQEIMHHLPGKRLAFSGDRIFEIKQRDIGAALHRLGHFLIAVAGGKQS